MSSKLYNFEDYGLYFLRDNVLESKGVIYATAFDKYSWGSYYYMPISRSMLNKGPYSLMLSEDAIKENPSVLATAKTAYIHPNSKVSRSVISQKYKKALDPWTADVVVIPPIPDMYADRDECAIFINEENKQIILFSCFWSNDAREKLTKARQGTKLRNLLSGYLPPTEISLHPNIVPVLDAQLDYFGPMLLCYSKELYVFDILSGALPKDKLVFDSTIMKTLSTEDNQPTLENLININEMLASSDADTQGAAIKALSMMDYMNYPNSIKLILRENQYLWKYNPATNTTAAKYMFQQLLGGTARRHINFNSKTITSKDFALFKDLYEYLHKDDNSTLLEYARIFDFFYEDVDCRFHPRIKD